NDKTGPGDAKLITNENEDDTDTRLEAYAKLLNEPLDGIHAGWKNFSDKTGVAHLSDVDVTSVTALNSFIFGFVARTDTHLRFLARKIFGGDKDQLIGDFQAQYAIVIYGTYDTQDKFNAQFAKEFGKSVEDLKAATSIFARLLQQDLNTLFPERFTVTFNL